MTWVLKRTETFLEPLKTIKKNKKALEELDKKIKRLQEDPIHVAVGFPMSCVVRRQQE